jgi:CheY-like chemotaxis protein
MILFVDDEKRYMDSHKLELEMEGHTVSFHNDVDSALGFFKENADSIQLIILDIMMPPGQSFQDENTGDGLRTGVRFYERIRGLAPRLPIIIFTNVSDEQLEKKFQGDINCRFLRKEDYLPHDLAEVVSNITPPPRKT